MANLKCLNGFPEICFLAIVKTIKSCFKAINDNLYMRRIRVQWQLR